MEWYSFKTAGWDAFNFAKQSFLTIYNVLIINPLRDLYMNGPAPLFWHGLSPAEICHTMSPLASVAFWEQNERECSMQIDNKFNTILYILHYAMYFFVLYRTWCCATWMFWMLFCRMIPRRRRRYDDQFLLE
jgi:hypothetical protein